MIGTLLSGFGGFCKAASLAGNVATGVSIGCQAASASSAVWQVADGIHKAGLGIPHGAHHCANGVSIGCQAASAGSAACQVPHGIHKVAHGAHIAGHVVEAVAKKYEK